MRVTQEEFAEVVTEADHPLIEREIAEAVGMSRPGVRKRREEIQNHPDVEHTMIGGANVYWPRGAFDVGSDAEETPTDVDEEADGQTVTMHQIGGKRIATTALGLVAVQLFAAQFPIELPVWALIPAALVGVALIAWGMAPLVRRTGTSTDEEVSASV